MAEENIKTAKKNFLVVFSHPKEGYQYKDEGLRRERSISKERPKTNFLYFAKYTMPTGQVRLNISNKI